MHFFLYNLTSAYLFFLLLFHLTAYLLPILYQFLVCIPFLLLTYYFGFNLYFFFPSFFKPLSMISTNSSLNISRFLHIFFAPCLASWYFVYLFYTVYFSRLHFCDILFCLVKPSPIPIFHVVECLIFHEVQACLMYVGELQYQKLVVLQCNFLNSSIKPIQETRKQLRTGDCCCHLPLCCFHYTRLSPLGQTLAWLSSLSLALHLLWKSTPSAPLKTLHTKYWTWEN